MIRKILALSSVLVIALSLCACANDGNIDITFKRKDSPSAVEASSSEEALGKEQATTEPEVTTEAVTESEGTLYSAMQEVNVRRQPNLDASVQILGQLAFNQQVLVKNITDGWAEISYNGETAYVSAEYLTRAE